MSYFSRLSRKGLALPGLARRDLHSPAYFKDLGLGRSPTLLCVGGRAMQGQIFDFLKAHPGFKGPITLISPPPFYCNVHRDHLKNLWGQSHSSLVPEMKKIFEQKYEGHSESSFMTWEQQAFLYHEANRQLEKMGVQLIHKKIKKAMTADDGSLKINFEDGSSQQFSSQSHLFLGGSEPNLPVLNGGVKSICHTVLYQKSLSELKDYLGSNALILGRSLSVLWFMESVARPLGIKVDLMVRSKEPVLSVPRNSLTYPLIFKNAVYLSGQSRVKALEGQGLVLENLQGEELERYSQSAVYSAAGNFLNLDRFLGVHPRQLTVLDPGAGIPVVSDPHCPPRSLAHTSAVMRYYLVGRSDSPRIFQPVVCRKYLVDFLKELKKTGIVGTELVNFSESEIEEILDRYNSSISQSKMMSALEKANSLIRILESYGLSAESLDKIHKLIDEQVNPKNFTDMCESRTLS